MRPTRPDGNDRTSYSIYSATVIVVGIICDDNGRAHRLSDNLRPTQPTARVWPSVAECGRALRRDANQMKASPMTDQTRRETEETIVRFERAIMRLMDDSRYLGVQSYTPAQHAEALDYYSRAIDNAKTQIDTLRRRLASDARDYVSASEPVAAETARETDDELAAAYAAPCSPIGTIRVIRASCGCAVFGSGATYTCDKCERMRARLAVI